MRSESVAAVIALVAVPAIAWGAAPRLGAAGDDISAATILAAALVGIVMIYTGEFRLLGVGLLLGSVSAVLIFLQFFFE